MALEDAVRAQVDDWGLAATAEAAAALDICRRLEAERTPAPSAAAMLHSQLRALLSDLRSLAPEEQTSDEIDEVAAQREARRRAAGMA